MLATSCTEEITSERVISKTEISVKPNVKDIVSRATETTIDNLQSFQTYSFVEGQNNYMDGVTYSNSSGNWKTEQGTFYWPASGELNFYSYAPYAGISADISSYHQVLKDFSPEKEASNQVDLVYAKATGSLAANGTEGVDFDFYHALSQVKVLAINKNAAFEVEISGVRIGNVISEADFNIGDMATYPEWKPANERRTYTQQWSSPVTLDSKSSTLDISENETFMLIPQQLEGKDNPSEGTYIALDARITMQGGHVVHDGWVYVGVSTNWAMGNCYTYTVDFTTGIGKDENGNAYISNKRANYSVHVSPWNGKSESLPIFYVNGKNNTAETFLLTIDDKQIDVAPDEKGNWKYDVTNNHPSSLKGFLKNSPVQTVSLSGLDVSEALSTAECFFGCTSMKSCSLKRWDTSHVTDMSEMFCGCSSLESLDLSGWNTANVTQMADMFNSCGKLKTINMVGCDATTVSKIKSALTDAGLSTDIVKTTK